MPQTEIPRRVVTLEEVTANAPAETIAEARNLYLAMGSTPCPRYNDNPIAGVEYLMKLL